MNKIHLISLDSDSFTMFRKRGWDIVEASQITPDTFILFSGGADVSPFLYDAQKHRTTRNDPKRDDFETGMFKRFQDNKKIGICRGGQFLNVMSGGKMYQNIDNHCDNHILFDCDTDERIEVTSTHHQMMYPSQMGQIVCTANESTFRQTDIHEYLEGVDYPAGSDVEVVYYPHTKSLCYQPHPEYGLKSCEDHFFDVIKRYHQ